MICEPRRVICSSTSPDCCRHVVFISEHVYNAPDRLDAYAWLNLTVSPASEVVIVVVFRAVLLGVVGVEVVVVVVSVSVVVGFVKVIIEVESFLQAVIILVTSMSSYFSSTGASNSSCRINSINCCDLRSVIRASSRR